MKRIFSLLLVLLLVLTVFVACGKDDENDDPCANGHTYVDGVCSVCQAADPDYVPVDADLKSAYDYIHQMIKDVPESTIADYTVILEVVVGDKTYAVTWEIVGTDAVVIENGTVKIPEPADAAIPYTLKFSVANAAGETLSREYSKVVPAFAYTTFDEYVEMKDDTALVISGVVTGVVSKSTGSGTNGLYIQAPNNEGGFYVYGLTDDVYETVKPGMTVKVKGNKDTYNGTLEVVNATVEVIDSTIKPVTPVDFTEIIANAADLKATELVYKQGMLVTIKGVTILEAGDNGYYYFQAGSHKVYLRISSSNNPCTSADLDAIKALHAANYGNGADVTGVISIYSGNFYLSPVSADAFSNVQATEKTDEEIIDIELGNIKFDSKIYKDQVINLIANGANYKNVAFTWTVEGTGAAIADGKLTITVPETDSTITVTVVAALNDASKTETYTIKLSKTVYTVKDALDMAADKQSGQYTSEKFLFTGVIIATPDAGYGNTTIKDADGNEIYLYGIYSEDGKDKYEKLAYKPVEGDTITVFAVVGDYNGTKQIKSGWLVSYVKGDAGTDEPTPEPETYPVVNELKTGDVVIIGAPAYNMALSADKVSADSYYNKGVDYSAGFDAITDAELFVVTVNADGSYTFTSKTGVVIALADSYSSLSNDGVNKSWTLVAKDGATGIFYVKNTVRGNYLEWYAEKNNWSTYGTSSLSDLFEISFYLVEEGTGSGDVTPDPDPTPDPTPSVPTVVTTPAVDTPYYMGVIYQDKVNYITGKPQNASTNFRHLFSTATGDACVFKLETADGGFYLTAEIDGAKKYYNIKIVGTYVNVLVEDEPVCVWTWSEEYQTLIVTVEGKGDYAITQTGTYNNVEAKTVTTTGVKAQLYTYVTPHTHEYTETDKVDATCTTAGSVTKACACGDVVTDVIPAPGHTYVDGECTVCGTAKPTTGLVNATISFDSTANRTYLDTSKQVWVQNDITVTNNKGSSTSNIVDYSKPARFYKSSELIIEGIGMTTIVFDCNSGDYATALKNSIGTVAGATVTVASDKVTVVFTEAVDSFTISLSGGQVRMDSITVNP